MVCFYRATVFWYQSKINNLRETRIEINVLQVLNLSHLLVGYSSALAFVKLVDRFSLTLVAGSRHGNLGYVDGIGESARFSNISGIGRQRDGFVVADLGNSCLRRVDKASFNTTTYAGLCQVSGTNDGQLRFARFTSPRCIVMVGRFVNSFYLVDLNVVRKVAGGIVTTLTQLTLDGDSYLSITFSENGRFFATTEGGKIVKHRNDKPLKVVAGTNCSRCSFPDLNLTKPSDLLFVNKHVLLVADTVASGIWVINLDLETVDFRMSAQPKSLAIDEQHIFVGGTNEITRHPYLCK